jgi:hypothetical protein
MPLWAMLAEVPCGDSIDFVRSSPAAVVVFYCRWAVRR